MIPLLVLFFGHVNKTLAVSDANLANGESCYMAYEIAIIKVSPRQAIIRASVVSLVLNSAAPSVAHKQEA